MKTETINGMLVVNYEHEHLEPEELHEVLTLISERGRDEAIKDGYTKIIHEARGRERVGK
jgi:hypothetical protein